jgi:hypothetical protein
MLSVSCNTLSCRETNNHSGSYAATGTGNDGNLAGQREFGVRGVNRGVHIVVDVLCELKAASALC